MTALPGTERLEIDLPAGRQHGRARMAGTLFCPVSLAEGPVPVFFCLPGGGYSRHYFSMAFPGLPGGATSYNEAAFHTARGAIVVAIDCLDAGESHGEGEPHSLAGLAEAHHETVHILLGRLRAGTLSRGLPPVEPLALGVGQSLGGAVTLVAQARHQTFAGIALLGTSAIEVQLPLTPAGEPDWVLVFHAPGTPPEIVALDLGGGYPVRRTSPVFGSARIPAMAPELLRKDCLVREAGAVRVPVFLGFGAERDVSADPYAEPGVYRQSPEVTLALFAGMAHMHNFAPSRRRLWEALHHWALSPALADCLPSRTSSALSRGDGLRA